MTLKKHLLIQNLNTFLTCFNNVHILGEENIISSDNGAHFVICTIIPIRVFNVRTMGIVALKYHLHNYIGEIPDLLTLVKCIFVGVL